MKARSAILCALLLAGAGYAGVEASSYAEIDVIVPPVAGGIAWDGDRMRGARERLKDILPGPQAAG